MPIYEYRCSACGHEQEILCKMSDAPLTVCPSCGKAAFNKLVSAAGFQLKGSGWYATDFKGGGKRPDKEDAAKAEAKAGGDAKSAGDSNVKSDPQGGEAAKHKDASKTKGESRPKQEAKPKEEAKAAASSGTGASPVGQ